MNEINKPSGVGVAVLEVMKSVKYIKQTGRMKAGNTKYNYLKESDLIGAIRPAMVSAGLVLIPVSVEMSTVHHGENQYGKVQWRSEGIWKWALMHPESGSTITVQSVGMAVDGGDKGANQAQTHAYKNLLRGLFLVESGDEPDAVASVDQEVAAAPPVKAGHHPDFIRLRKWWAAEMRHHASVHPGRFMEWVGALEDGKYGRPSSWNEHTLRRSLAAARLGNGPNGVPLPADLYEKRSEKS